MGRHHRRAKAPRRSSHALAAASTSELPEAYRRACRLAADGQHDEARRLYVELDAAASDARLRALIGNDLAALDAVAGDFDAARRGLAAALAIDESCRPARLNLELLVNRLAPLSGREHAGEAEADPARAEPRPPQSAERDAVSASAVEPKARFLKVVGKDIEDPASGVVGTTNLPDTPQSESAAPTRVAILSFLFNWPSTGGGNIHTVELATFLGRAGYEIQLIYARHPEWGIGRVEDGLPFRSEALEFDASGWGLDEIQTRYRRAVQSFDPDYVIITDAWNMKPILAGAVQGYPYYLRFQALECLCPLNNLRLLARDPEGIEQCPCNQLANPDVCRRCLVDRGHCSGSLHQCERELCQVGTPEYDRKLRHAMQEAEAVLVLNPLVAALVEPYARNVRVVPWGMDPSRFPWPPVNGVHAGTSVEPEDGVVIPSASATAPPVTLFMAAVQGEFIKGYHVAREACRLLRQSRIDFELVVTFDPPGRIDEFTRSVGWCSQTDLPRHYHAADICLVPTIAQEGLSRTSVEAMASGIPVVASRIGGLPFTVSDGVTGLLFEPGDPADMSRQIARLLDDPGLRRQMGLAGRHRFEEEFQWDHVIERYYRPLLARRRVGSRK